MQIDEKLYEELITYLGRRPLAEVYGLYTKLALSKAKKPEITEPAPVETEAVNG
jgi:hypothetical protein